MKLIPIETGWRVEVSDTSAVEFYALHEARDFMDAIDSGLITTEALETVLRRRERKEKHEQTNVHRVTRPYSPRLQP